MEMKKVNPIPEETYCYAIDDKCLVVGSSFGPKIKVWLSKAMVEWISTKGKKELDEYLEQYHAGC